MAWTLVEGANTAVFPTDPSSIIDDNPADDKETVLPGGAPLIMSFGSKARKLTISGIMYDPTKTKAQLETDVVSKIKAMKGKVVTLSGAASWYNGDWLMRRPMFEEVGGYTRSFKYKIEMVQGSDYIVL